MKIKKILIILIIVAAILGIILLILKNQIKAEKEKLPEQENIILETIDYVEEVSVRNEYYLVKSCIDEFYKSYSEIYQGSSKITEKQKKQLYSFIDKEYIDYKNITIDNIISIFPKIGEIKINIEKMYTIQKNDIFAYFVYGTKKDSLNSNIEDFCIMVKVDTWNKTFKILLQDYVENKYKNIQTGKKIKIEGNTIENNVYNTYSYKHINDEQYIQDLFEHFKSNIENKREKSFYLIDQAYKEKCFDGIEEYIKYINENYSKIINVRFHKYTKNKKESYTEYIFINSIGTEYIFKETAPFKYTVTLDNYIVPNEDYVEKYNKSSEEQKAILNIKRFFMAIDDEKYTYAYSLLSDRFKNSNNLNKQNFINYAKENFFGNNYIYDITFENNIFKVKIIDKKGYSNEVKLFNIKVDLKNGTDFSISF